jgi:V8-like Glu-specific endopeptidase
MRIKYLALVLLTGFASVEAAAQSPLPRKDIPAIAKAANGAIVSIIMSDKGKPIAQGTGFVVSPDGVIVTNYHVISEGSSAIVKLPDGTAFAVDGVVASDKARDVAVIKTHGKTFQTLTLGNSDRVQVGEEVVAIGNPLSLESTVSNGIVSGIRVVKEEGKYLQVTAPISHGSSGGPLFNMSGEVVGITAAILEGGENLNFAIPINEAKRLLLNQSAKLQNLPNEAPVSTQAPDADAQKRAIMSQQKMCSEQTKSTFKDRGYPWVDSYRSHYNPSMGVCFVEEVRRPPTSDGGMGVTAILIQDAFEGQTYGMFDRIRMEGVPNSGMCFIRLSGQPDITCKSEDEFNDLALKYFGITP